MQSAPDLPIALGVRTPDRAYACVVGFDLRVVDESSGHGYIELGEFREAIRVGVESAPVDWYLDQWQYSLGRLVARHTQATVVIRIPERRSTFASPEEVDIKPPSDDWQPILGFGESWTFALHDDGRIHVQNQLLFPELTVIDGFDIVRMEPKEDNDTLDDDEPDPVPSEWLLSLAEITTWLERSTRDRLTARAQSCRSAFA